MLARSKLNNIETLQVLIDSDISHKELKNND